MGTQILSLMWKGNNHVNSLILPIKVHRPFLPVYRFSFPTAYRPTTFEASKQYNMKKVLAIAGIVVLLVTVTGCLSTLHPLFTDKDFVFEPLLVGSWKDVTDSNEVMTFERGTSQTFGDLPQNLQQNAGNAYVMTVRNPQKKEEFRYYAFLGKLGGGYYLDYYPAENRRQKTYDAFYKQHLIKMHSIYRVKFNGNKSVEISQFDESYMRNLINKKKIRIEHEVYYDGSYVITSPTEQLQQYVLKYGNVEEAYYSNNKNTYNKIQ